MKIKKVYLPRWVSSSLCSKGNHTTLVFHSISKTPNSQPSKETLHIIVRKIGWNMLACNHSHLPQPILNKRKGLEKNNLPIELVEDGMEEDGA